jgi:hypothetical protein
MDSYKHAMTSYVGVGGLHCYCCNSYKGKTKRKLNRMARRKLKNDFKKENIEE